ncbi:MAG: hypothetical protein HY567_03295 [Candidatus Kerfeldbacteria bacterium]|nr:hypothetical protein [Candidatus Kerfeldbacteria bacterium]
MKLRPAYTTTLVLASFGLLLSGYLSYWNLWGPSCHQGPLSWLVSCGGPQKVLIFGLPTCVYGFFMYLAVAVTALIGLTSNKHRGTTATLIGLGSLGTAFAGGLMIYEIFVLKLTFTTVPACVYGLVLYLGILTAAIVGRRSISRSPASPPSDRLP